MGKVYMPQGLKNSVTDVEFKGGFQASVAIIKGVYLIELKMSPSEYGRNLYVYLDEADLASLDFVRQVKKEVKR